MDGFKRKIVRLAWRNEAKLAMAIPGLRGPEMPTLEITTISEFRLTLKQTQPNTFCNESCLMRHSTTASASPSWRRSQAFASNCLNCSKGCSLSETISAAADSKGCRSMAARPAHKRRPARDVCERDGHDTTSLGACRMAWAKATEP